MQKPGKLRSEVWTKFHEIFFMDTSQKIDHFYYCVECADIIDNLYLDGNTNRFKRHVCIDNNNNNDGNVNNNSKLVISKLDKDKLKTASVKFVAKDLRPYFALECEGLLDLCEASMKFGQKYRRAGRSDLSLALPSRNTVKDAVCKFADDTRKSIADLLKQAIKFGGVAATTDTWTDDYRKTSYICVVAHICIKQTDRINYQRFVLSTSEINEVVKTGNIKFIIRIS